MNAMNREFTYKVLLIADNMCRNKHRVSMYDKLGLSVENAEDLATVLCSPETEKAMSTGRVEFSKSLPAIGATIGSVMMGPLGIVIGSAAGLAWMLRPEQKIKNEVYRDIIEQLYSDPTLYRAFKRLPGDGLSKEEAAERLIKELDL